MADDDIGRAWRTLRRYGWPVALSGLSPEDRVELTKELQETTPSTESLMRFMGFLSEGAFSRPQLESLLNATYRSFDHTPSNVPVMVHSTLREAGTCSDEELLRVVRTYREGAALDRSVQTPFSEARAAQRELARRGRPTEPVYWTRGRRRSRG